MGAVDRAIPPGATVVVIDHHLCQDPDGDLNFVDPTYAAVGEIIANLFDRAGLVPSYEAAQCAYVALATDTGGFRFSNTTPRALRVAANLVETGIDVAEISARIFDAMSPGKFRLLAHLLNNVQFTLGGRLAYAAATQSDMDGAAAQSEDTDGLINFARNVEGVDVAILFREEDPHTTKVSLRSTHAFNAAKALEAFGGGGHASAAGATVDMPLETARSRVLARVRELMENDR